jgi:hypothetical protein
MPCVVRDISEVGAKVEVDFPFWLPARFRLTIAATGLEADCEIKYRTEDAVGVRFSRVLRDKYERPAARAKSPCA